MMRTLCMSALLIGSLSACDQVNDVLNKQKATGKAIGAACRQSGRSLEDCYKRNAKISKPDIYTGWKEMSEYMQAKKLDVIPPPPDEPKEEAAGEHPAGDKASETASEPVAHATASAASEIKPATKTASKAPAKH